MASTLEYMQFATGVYAASDANTLNPTTASGWTRTDWQPDITSGLTVGFSAGCYMNGTEMVISYTGTNDVADMANWLIGLGEPMPQIFAAIDYYFKCKAAHPEATNITFTGHSLGGGLASLMSVYFDKQATVFDEAPFQFAALNPLVTVAVGNYISNNKYLDTAMSDYLSSAGLLALSREANVVHYYVDGEALNYPRFSIDTLVGSIDSPISLANSTAGAVERHSMALMTALQLSDSFHQVAQKIPDLVSMMLDGNLFGADALARKPDLLRTLLRHQLGVAGVQPDDMLNRFAADMNSVAQAQSSGRSVFYSTELLLKSVIAFAMEKYYSEETSGDPNVQQQLFEVVTGGLQFDTTRINADITSAKGYARYFTNYLNTDGVFAAGERDLIRSKIADMKDWSIAVSESGMTATDSKNNGAFMLGNNGGDTLTGGTANDLLVGGRGSDTLDGGDGTDTLLGGKDGDTFTGGQGTDALYGGAGSDTYNYTTGDGSDTIYDYNGDGYDGDGKGRIQYDGTGLSGGIGGDTEGEVKKATAGGTFKSSDDKYTYTWGGEGSDLTVNGNITVKNFHNGDLGITLYTRQKNPPAPIPDSVADATNRARTAVQRFGDPLTLDLNGNGIETVPLKRPPLLFDINANGIKISTGWIAPSDGLLVLDRNGNGVVDSGAELFGDRTPAYGSAGTTADGFAALAQEDTNHDGMVNAQDANWANLRVWQDLNQDGLSQPDELTTLESQGIASFNTARTAHSQMLPSGNQMADLGTFTRTDGSTGATGAPQGMADINLALDTFHRTFVDSIPLTVEAQALPDMQGSGKVRDMREAASLQTAAGQAFATALANFSAATTREDQLAQLDNLITAWADTSGFGTLQERAAAHGYTFTIALNADWQRKLTALEAFNGQGYFRMPWEGASFGGSALQGLTVGYGGNPKAMLGQFWGAQLNPLGQAYDALRDSIYQALLPQTRLKPYLDAVRYSVDASGLQVDFSAVQTAFANTLATNPDKALGDLLEFNRYGKTLFQGTSWETQGWEELGAMLNSVTITPAIQKTLSDFNIGLDGHPELAVSSGKAQVLVAADAGSTLSGAGYDDVLVGRAGSDTLNGGSGNDMLLGGSGSDTLDGGWGADTLQGGAGSDTLAGGYFNDTYLYNRGDGADTIVDSNRGYWGSGDINTLQFGTGIAAADIAVKYDGATGKVILDLGNGDAIDIGDPRKDMSYGLVDGTWTMLPPMSIQQLRFADGSVISTDILLKQRGMTQNGTAGADTLQGSNSLDYADVLNGGAGDDSLSGGSGSDTYVYNLGDGADTISDSGLLQYNWRTGKNQYTDNNTLEFGPGIDATMVTPSFDSVTQTAVLTLLDGGRIDVGALNDLSIQTLQFADGSTVSLDTLFAQQLLEQMGTAGADVLTGTDSTVFGDHLRGMAGDDTLDGGKGSDVLDGGAGSDTLRGGGGNDTYVYNLGDGADTIIDTSVTQNWWRTVAEQNTISFGAGITADMVTPRFDSSTQTVYLDLGPSPSSGQVRDSIQIGTLDNFSVQSVQFEDGTRLDVAAWLADVGLAQDGTEGGDTITGSGSLQYSDYLYGNGGADTLLGGAGDDVLDGGAGNDTLNGGAGDDTYNYWLGEGYDSIVDNGRGNVLNIYGGHTSYATTYDPLTQTWTTTSQWNVASSADVVGVDYDGKGGEIRLSLADGSSIGIGTYVTWNSWAKLSVDTINFADGTTLSPTQYLNQNGVDIWAIGDGSDEVLTGMTQYENRIYGDIGNDTLTGGDRNDTLDGWDGNDMLVGGYGDDRLIGGRGNDTLSGGAGNDTYDFSLGDGNDTIADSGADNTLNIDGSYTTTSGQWQWTPSTGSQWVTIEQQHVVAAADITGISYDGQNGSIRMGLTNGESIGIGAGLGFTAQMSVGTINFADGSVADATQVLFDKGVDIQASGNGDVLVGLDWFNNRMTGGDGNDALLGGNAGNTMDAGLGDDVLSGGSSDDVLNGGEGSDSLFGRGGSDTLDGGAGSDVLQGGAGDDVYVFGYGSGNDVIVDGEGWDVIRIGERINESDLQFRKDGVDLRISIANSADSLTIKDWFTGNSSVNTLDFVDRWGNVWYSRDLTTIGMALAAETAVGSNLDETLLGSIYNDSLQGSGGNDTLIGGEGNDTYIFNAGDGVDALYELSGNDTIVFGADITPDMVRMDMSVISAGGWGVSSFPSPDADLMARDSQRQVLNIQIGAQGDAIRVMSGKGAIERFQFADGSTYTVQQLAAMQGLVNVIDTNDNSWQPWNWSPSTGYTLGNWTSPHRTLDGLGAASDFNGGIGNDTALGGMHDDVYRFSLGDGADVIADLGGINEISFGANVAVSDVSWSYDPAGPTPFVLNVGNGGDSIAILNGERGAIQRFSFADGSVLTFDELIASQGGINLAATNTADQFIAYSNQARNNLIIGGDGADTINLDSGSNNFIVGGKGNDRIDTNGWSNAENIVLLNLGDGQDELVIGEASHPVTVLFGANIDQSSLKITAYDYVDEWGNRWQDMLIEYGNQGDQVFINGSIPQPGEGGNDPSLRVKFADGTELNYTELMNKASADHPVSDVPSGRRIIADPVSPVLVGGTGNDTFVIGNQPAEYRIIDNVVGSGSNTVELGWDTGGISDQSTLEDAQWTMRATAAPGSVYRLSIDGTNLLVSFDNGVTLRIDGFDPLNPFDISIKEFRFANGRVLSLEQMLAQGFDLAGTDNAEDMAGTVLNDRIQSGNGDDYLDGRMGNDVLAGGDGNDTYAYNRGDGADVIVDHAGYWDRQRYVTNENVLQFGNGIDAASVAVKFDPANGQVFLDLGNGDSVNIGTPDDLAIQSVQFVDGTVWDGWALIDRISAGNNLNAVPDANLSSATGGMTGNVSYHAVMADGSPLPSWLTFDTSTNTFGGTPGNSDVGTLHVRVNMTDGAGIVTAQDFALEVINVNDTPTLSQPVADQSTPEDAPFSFTVPAETFHDVDFIHGDSLTYRVTMRDTTTGAEVALPDWLSFDAATQTFSGTPDNWDVGSLNVTVTATDTGGLSASSTFVLEVVNVNDAPVANARLNNASISQDQAFHYSLADQQAIAPPPSTFLSDETDAGTPDQAVSSNSNYLNGTGGDDMYSFSRGDGNVWIYDGDYSSMDRVQLTDVASGDVSVSQDQSGNVTLSVNGTSDSLTLGNWLSFDAYKIEQLSFADGVVWGTADIQSRLSVAPTEGNDYITGTSGDDTITALSGDDTLFGSNGNDVLQGGDGNDALYSGSGDNTLSGGAGNDSLYADVGNDMLDGGEGADYLWGSDGNDTLNGGGGNDQLDGGGGNDTYLFGRGSGQDSVYEWDDAPGNVDTVQFGADVSSADVAVYENQFGDLVLSIDGTTDTLTVNGWFSADANKVEQFVFADGTVWGINDILALKTAAPVAPATSGDDNLVGTVGNDTIKALAGNDALIGGAGDDNLIGGAGNDILNGGIGSDLLSGGSGADELTSDNNYTDTANDLLDGGAGNDYVSGSISNDLLIGGAGDDELGGDDGNDVVLFNRGDGNDWYYSNWSENGVPLAQRTDTVSLGGGIGYADLSFSRDANDLILNTGNGESITFSNWFDSSWQDNKAISTLQVVVESMASYDPASADPLLSRRIQQFDFVALANQFEAASTADPTITTWQLAPHLADFSLGGSDTAAIGGDMAYLYGKNGNLDGLSESALRAQLNDANFGLVNQSLSPAESVVSLFSDVDFIHGDRLSYSATLADGSALPGWLVFDAATGVFSGTPSNQDVGSLSVMVTATDTGGLSANRLFNIDVANVNDAPTVSVALADQATLQDAQFSFTVPAGTFNDVDFIHGDTLNYSATLADGTALPSWLTFDAATGTFSGTPTNGDVGNLSVQVTATDTGGLSASSAFNLNVVNVNDTPTANADMGAATEDGGTVLLDAATLLANDTDPDFIHGNTLSIVGVSQAASGATVSLVNGGVQYDTGTLFQSLGQGQTATDTFSYTVSDTAGATSTATVTMTVTGVNDGPVTANDTAAVQEDGVLVASGNVLANDSDVDQGSVLAVANAGVFAGQYGQLTLNADGSYGYTLDNALVQSLGAGQSVTETFAYQATDGIAVTPATLTVTINGTNDAPVAITSIAGPQTNEDVPFNFTVPTGSFTDIDHGDTLIYNATLADGSALPTWLGFDAVTQTFSGTPGNWDVGNYSITVTATDSGGLSASSTFAIDVANVNDAPTVSVALADHAAIQDVAFSFTVPAGTFDDVDFIHGDTLSYNATLADGSALPSWLTFDTATGTFSGTPNNWDVGGYSVTVTATDTAGFTASSTFAIDVANVNDAPTVSVALADHAAIQDVAFSFTVPAGTFDDVDFIHGDMLSYSATLSDGTALPSWLSFDAATQTFNGTPTNGDVGNYSVTVTATDRGGLSASSTFAVDVANVNDAPTVSVALADHAAIQDVAFSFTVPAGTFADVDFIHGDTLSYNATLADGSALPSWLTFDAATQTFRGTPTNGDVGNLHVRVTATDTGGLSASSAFSLNVVNVNDTPTAHADTGVATEDGGVVLLAAATLLANDTDPDFIHGDTLNIVGVSQTASGAAVSLVNGTVQYDAGTLFQSLGQGQTATDTFSYTVSDTAGATSTATVTMTVTGANDGPVTQDDSATLTQNAQQPASGNVLANDSDIDQGTVLGVANAGVIAGNYGSLTLNADGSYRYTLDNTLVQSLGAGQSVTETFTYQATDGIAITPATLSVTITGTNDAPVVASPIAGQQTNEDAPFNFAVPAGSFTDIDHGDVLSYSATLSDGRLLPSWLTFDAATQTFSGTPGNWDVGNYSISVTATDSGGLSASSTFAVDVANVNDAPTVSMALLDQGSLQDAALSFIVPAGTFDDVDFIHGDTLSYSATLADGSALPGWLSFDAATQTFSGTPTNGDVGNLRVQVTATDTGGLSASSAFSLNVANVNDTPTAHADAGTATEDGGAVLLAAATLLANDTDPDFIHGDVLNIVGVSQADSGASVSFVNGSVQYDIGSLFQSLAQGQTATDTFSYTVSDTAGATSTATVTMIVTGANDGPVTANDTAAVQEDGVLVASGNVLANDSDVDQGAVLRVANAGTLQGVYGSLVLNADGSYSYALDNASLAVQSLAAGQVVTETFAYQATDGIATTPATLTVTITGSNDAPVAQNDSATVDENSPLSIQQDVLLANDTDADVGDTKTLNRVDSVSASGAAVSLVNGRIVYDHGGRFNSLMAGQSATDSFGYTMTDSAGATSSATVNVTVTGVNDGPQANGDSVATNEDTPQIVLTAASLLANDTDPDAGDTLSISGFDGVTALGNAVRMDAAGNLTFDMGNRYQHLAQGETLTDTFGYTVADTAGATSTAQVSVTITGVNDAPMVVADTAAVQEDTALTATGNVLANDSDVDQGTVLSVADAGVRAGTYGSLTLAADGSYTYSLANSSAAVQALGRGTQVAEHFAYTATDGITGTASVLDVLLTGANDAPIVVSPLADRNIARDQHFSWQMPADSFTDIDQGDVLDYTATLADGAALPEWLKFDAATRTFSGEAPKQKGYLDVRITATDKVAATGSTAGSLSASDVFRITVGNRDEHPAPGGRNNVNPGTGHAGSGNASHHATDSGVQGHESGDRASGGKADQNEAHAKDREDKAGRSTEELIRSWFDKPSASEQFSSFSLMERNSGRGSQTEWQVNRNVAKGVAGDVSSEWERMNARLKQHLEQVGGDEGSFADSGAGSGSFGLYGSHGAQNLPLSGMGNSQQMKGFAGLKEGLERLAG